jgi:hypothetical protein
MGCKQKPHKMTQSGLMYALVDKLSEAARAELVALGESNIKTSNTTSNTTSSSAATSSNDSGDVNSSPSNIVSRSSDMMEWEFYKYCSLPIDRNPDNTDKGDATTLSLVSFDIMLKVGIVVVVRACVRVRICSYPPFRRDCSLSVFLNMIT